ncbi:sporulation protein [Brevibacillus choshinensis]|uniref:Sporulation protein n=1 Tax=Brevibacillus choshinensis TaxID=54911 RepID=A0ABX7FRV2_BRECH|nr:sporulation protein [Brevibacillus choshinensis]QRG68046.1 sporulation protein [Brevibacillus choshinensis]
MLKKLMAKIGVGAAKVDLQLDRSGYRLGETMTGVVRIEGGNVEQRISDLSAMFMMKAYVKGQEVTKPVQLFPIKSHFTVQPKPSVMEIPFAFELPEGLAMSTPSIQYYLHTKLDVEMALDPTDMDYIQVLAPVAVERVLYALERLDLRQKPDSGKLTPYGQEFSFFPGTQLGIPLKELEVIFFSAPGELKLLVELDLATGFLRREVEYKAEIVIPQGLLEAGQEEELSRFLLETIREYANNPSAIPYVSMAAYRQGQYGHHSHRGSGMGGMIGGMAAGFLGGMLLNEMMFGDDEVASDDMGGDEGEDGGGFDFGGFDDEL